MHIPKEKGFTLIELLVVISIISLLSTFAVIGLGSARQKGRDAKRLSDVKQLQTSLEFYFSENNQYPAAPASSLGSGDANVLCDAGFLADSTGCAADKIYMGQVPANPSPGGAAYSYTAVGTPPTSYEITFQLEAGTESLPGGVALKATPSGVTQ